MPRRESQYIDSYLDDPVRYTVQSYIARAVRSSKYRGDYARSLQNAINRRLESGEVTVCQSVRGGVSYRRITGGG
jgi:hypothetical protein